MFLPGGQGRRERGLQEKPADTVGEGETAAAAPDASV